MKEAGTSKKMLRKFCLLFALTIFPSFLFACNAGNLPAPPTVEGAYAVDPLFREFYFFLGGQDTLGAVISPVYLKDQASYQYTDAALMVYDPLAPADKRFGLASLGLDMNIAGQLDPQLSAPDPAELKDPVIDPEFAALYERLGGESFVGRPITEVRYNPERRRYEQFFEKLGFYRLEDDPDGSVRLLAYGAWKCDLNCRSMAPLNSVIELPKRTRQKANEKSERVIENDIETGGEQTEEKTTGEKSIPYFYAYIPYLSKSRSAHNFFLPIMVSGFSAQAAFSQASTRLAAEFTGHPLSAPFLSQEGQLEQIFENIVLIARLENPEKVSLLALPIALGLIPAALEPANTDPVMIFYPVEGELGYNIPAYFLHYIELNGGLQVSGPPVTRFEQLSDSIYRQCFANICLEEERSTPEGLRIRLAPIGYTYKTLFYPTLPDVSPAAPPGRDVILQIWESDSLLAQNERQEIGVYVIEDGAPVANVRPFLILSLPDGQQHTVALPPTGPDGQSRLQLDPLNMPNGSLIPYQVCISRSTGENYCVKDDFLIWENP